MGPKMADFNTYDNKYSWFIRGEEFLDWLAFKNYVITSYMYVSLYFISLGVCN